ncbi:hypothetical protein MHYP_G00280780 [Metynnis hypsauchen]
MIFNMSCQPVAPARNSHQEVEKMSRTMTVHGALEYILDQDNEEEESESEDDLEIKSDHDDKLSDDEG